MKTIEQFSIQAEQSVIGALLTDNDCIDRIGELKAEHFYVGDHKVIFSEILKQISSGKSCDVISVSEVLEKKIQNLLPYINDITVHTPSSANVGRYSSIVRDRALKRCLMALARQLDDEAGSSTEESGILIDRATSKLEKLAESRTVQEPVRASDELGIHIEELQNRLEGKGPKAISTGFPDVDKRLSGGMRRGELIVLAARPKMGKTAFALNIAANVAKDHSILVLSMEMPKSQLHDRNIASIGHVPLGGMLEPATLTEMDWNGITVAIQKIEKLNLFIDDQGGLRLLDIKMKAKQTKRRHGLDVLVIDYLQLMEGDGDNRNAQIEGITRGLKSLAKELKIAIILLSQLNRKLEERPNKRPQPSDLRDSGAIEQDADAVIFLYRDEVYNPDSMDKGICEVDVALCRQGAPGRVALTYIGEQTRFESAHQWQPQSYKPSQRRGLAENL